MLNYVWMALLILGLSAAIVTDIYEQSDNTYRNGMALTIDLKVKDSAAFVAKKQADIVVKLKASEFNSRYNANVLEGLEFPAKLTLSQNNTAALVFKTNASFPKIWQKMAKASGKEDDLTGTISNINITSMDFQKVNLVTEKVSLLKMKDVTNGAIEYAEKAVTIALGLIGIMAMWLGIMKLAEQAGIIKIIAKLMRPITKRLFPDVPEDHPAVGSIIMNISANFLGLSNAATPFGLKAMAELDTLNKNKGTATNAMCTFLAINTAGLTLIPATAIAIRSAMGSAQPAIIIGTSIFGSGCATIAAIIAVKLFENFPLRFSKISEGIKKRTKSLAVVSTLVVIIALLVLTGSTAGIIKVLSFVNPELLKNIIQIFSTVAIPLIILSFVSFAAFKKVKVYETFVEGAKEGFNVAIKIIPYLVAMLVAIGIFRAGGAMEWLIYLLKPITNFIGMPAEALPMALMRPLSGSGSLGIMSEVMSVHGTDSLLGIMVSTFYGSSETTFYVLAVYFGSVSVKNTRHALPAGLIADIAGMLGAVFIVKLLFG